MEDIKTIITEDVEISGSIKCTGGIRLGGKVSGDIQTAGDVLVEKTSAVKGNVTGNSVVVMGLVKGNIAARERLELKGAARVAGDIKAKRLVVEEGVSLVGKAEIVAGEGAGETASDADAVGSDEATKAGEEETRNIPGARPPMTGRPGQLFARK